MDLEPITLTPNSGNGRYAWQPFDPNPDFEFEFEFDEYWAEVKYDTEGDTYIKVLRGGVEVARVELSDHPNDYDTYTNTPLLAGKALEIVFLDVAETHRRRGIARHVIRLLAGAYNGRRLAAFSEGAEHFWDTLDWGRYEHARTPQLHRPLYIQPAVR